MSVPAVPDSARPRPLPTSASYGITVRLYAAPSAAVVGMLAKASKRARILANADEIVEQVAPELRSGDVVAILSNGGFGGIYEKLPQRIESLREVKTRV